MVYDACKCGNEPVYFAAKTDSEAKFEPVGACCEVKLEEMGFPYFLDSVVTDNFDECQRICDKRNKRK